MKNIKLHIVTDIKQDLKCEGVYCVVYTKSQSSVSWGPMYPNSVFNLFGWSTVCCGGLPKYQFTESKIHVYSLDVIYIPNLVYFRLG